jgi:hypothetical protein
MPASELVHLPKTSAAETASSDQALHQNRRYQQTRHARRGVLTHTITAHGLELSPRLRFLEPRPEATVPAVTNRQLTMTRWPFTIIHGVPLI